MQKLLALPACRRGGRSGNSSGRGRYATRRPQSGQRQRPNRAVARAGSPPTVEARCRRSPTRCGCADEPARRSRFSVLARGGRRASAPLADDRVSPLSGRLEARTTRDRVVPARQAQEAPPLAPGGKPRPDHAAHSAVVYCVRCAGHRDCALPHSRVDPAQTARSAASERGLIASVGHAAAEVRLVRPPSRSILVEGGPHGLAQRALQSSEKRIQSRRMEVVAAAVIAARPANRAACELLGRDGGVKWSVGFTLTAG